MVACPFVKRNFLLEIKKFKCGSPFPRSEEKCILSGPSGFSATLKRFVLWNIVLCCNYRTPAFLSRKKYHFLRRPDKNLFHLSLHRGPPAQVHGDPSHRNTVCMVIEQDSEQIKKNPTGVGPWVSIRFLWTGNA